MTEKTQDFDKNDLHITYILDITAKICKQKGHVDDDGKLILEWSNNGDHMIMRDAVKYLDIFRQTDYFKTSYKLDSFNRRLKENGFDHKLTMKKHYSKIQHINFHRNEPGNWPLIKNLKTRTVNKTDTKSNHDEILENYKKASSALWNTLSDMQNKHNELQNTVSKQSKEIDELKRLTYKFQHEQRKNNVQTYSMKKIMNIKGVDTSAIMNSAEFDIDEPMKQKICQDVAMQHYRDNTNHGIPASPDSSVSANSNYSYIKPKRPPFNKKYTDTQNQNITVPASPDSINLVNNRKRLSSEQTEQCNPEKYSKKSAINPPDADPDLSEIITEDKIIPSENVDSSKACNSTDFWAALDSIQN